MISKFNKRSINPMLLKVISISVLLHVVAAFIAGIITVATHVMKDEAQFEEPPQLAEEEPPTEVKIRISQQIPQQPVQQLQLKPVANIAVAEVDLDLPSMNEGFSVSAGIGANGGGNLMSGTRGSVGIGISDIKVFGLRAKAERILFLIDVNRSMVIDAKGGLNSFKIIKDEIINKVSMLSAGTLFNVILIDERKALKFKRKLAPSGTKIADEFTRWIAPVNTNAASPGLEGINYAEIIPDTLDGDANPEFLRAIKHFKWRNENINLMHTQFALMQEADAIFHITAYHEGFREIKRFMTEKEELAWSKIESDPKWIEKEAAYRKEEPIMEQRVKSTLAKINLERRSKGLPERVLNEEFGLPTKVNELGLKWNNPHPGWKPEYDYSVKDVENYVNKFIEIKYGQLNRPKPSINVILVLAKDEVFTKDKEKSLKSFVRKFSGSSEILRGANEIRSAASKR